MKTLLASLLMALAMTTPVMAQTAAEAPAATEDDASHGLGFWVEARTAAKAPSEVVVYFDKYLTDSVGFYAQMVKESDGYRSFYAGPKVKLGEGLEMGVGVGRETLTRHAQSTTVKNVWLSVDREKYALYATVEHGAGGTWHKATAMYKFTDAVNIGAMNESLLGSGPRVEWNFAKGAQAWIAILGGKPVLAVNYAF